jgi:hypothetical protein
MSATFCLSDGSLVTSEDLANAIANCIIHESSTGSASLPFSEIFDVHCEEILYNLLTLLQWTPRGKPRPQDLNGTRSGSTNAYAKFVSSDFLCCSLGDSKWRNLIMGRFPSLKYTGSQDREYPWLLLPEEVSRFLGIYLSVFRYAQVKVLENVINNNNWKKIDFGKLAKDNMTSAVDAKMLLLNQMTKFTAHIQVSKQCLTAKPMHNWDKAVQ